MYAKSVAGARRAGMTWRKTLHLLNSDVLCVDEHVREVVVLDPASGLPVKVPVMHRHGTSKADAEQSQISVTVHDIEAPLSVRRRRILPSWSIALVPRGSG